MLTPQLTINRSIIVGARKGRKQLLLELAQTVAEIRQEAKEKGLSKMPKREINAAVAATRRAMIAKKTGKRPAK